MSTIKAILFDLDNTLVDFIFMKEESCRAAVGVMVAAGLPMDEAVAYRELMKAYFAVGIESDNAFSEFLKSKGYFSHKILAAAINTYLDAKSRYLKPYANVKSVLEELQKRGIFLAIVTDAPKTKAYQRLIAMGIEPYFRFVVGYEDTNNLKNTGLPLTLALQLLGKELPNMANSEILMIGDSIERDVTPAKQLGLKVAWAKYGQKTSAPSTADYELEDIRDLVNIV
jgi:putative hydrolase of the HAD superfamily